MPEYQRPRLLDAADASLILLGPANGNQTCDAARSGHSRQLLSPPLRGPRRKERSHNKEQMREGENNYFAAAVAAAQTSQPGAALCAGLIISMPRARANANASHESIHRRPV